MNSELQICFYYNKELLRIFSKSFFMSTLLLPRNRRKAVFALYGFCRFADNLVDKPRDRSRQEIYDEIEALQRELRIAYRTGESEHPVLCAFIHVARAFNIPMEYPMDLFKGLLMDVDHKPYSTFDDLYLFCYRVAGVVGLMMTHILGYSDDAAFEYASNLGVAMQLTNILRDITEDKDNRRLYLPLDEMERFGVSWEDIEKERFTPHVRNLIEFSCSRARKYYDDAAPGIPMLDKKCRFAIYSAASIYGGILDKIAKNGYNPFKGRVYVSQAEKARIIVRNFLKGKLGRGDSSS